MTDICIFLRLKNEVYWTQEDRRIPLGMPLSEFGAMRKDPNLVIERVTFPKTRQ